MKDDKIINICKYFDTANLTANLQEIIKKLCEEGEYRNGKIKIFYYKNGIYYGDLGDEVFEIETIADLEKYLEEIFKPTKK